MCTGRSGCRCDRPSFRAASPTLGPLGRSEVGWTGHFQATPLASLPGCRGERVMSVRKGRPQALREVSPAGSTSACALLGEDVTGVGTDLEIFLPPGLLDDLHDPSLVITSAYVGPERRIRSRPSCRYRPDRARRGARTRAPCVPGGGGDGGHRGRRGAPLADRGPCADGTRRRPPGCEPPFCGPGARRPHRHRIATPGGRDPAP